MARCRIENKGTPLAQGLERLIFAFLHCGGGGGGLAGVAATAPDNKVIYIIQPHTVVCSGSNDFSL